MTKLLTINDTISIPLTEFRYRVSRSSGPGGQHVNTSSTRVEVLWDFERSLALDDAGRARLRKKLASRIDADGNLRVVAGERRSQRQNRASAEERLAALVRRAIVPAKPRRPTRPSRAAREERLNEKKRHGLQKRARRGDVAD
jgi:ribosome-associated protein